MNMATTINDFFPPVSEERLAEIEQKWGYTLPTDYRSFLLTYNGGEPEPMYFNLKGKEHGSDIYALLGINGSEHCDTEDYMQTYQGRLPSRFHPIGFDSGGNVICISVAGDDRGMIYFWDHEEEADELQGMTPDTTDNVALIAHTFSEFISGLFALELQG